MITKVVFQSSPYTVTLQKDYRLPISWEISDGRHSFTVGEEPVFDTNHLDTLMAEYLTLRAETLERPEKEAPQ